RDPIRSNRRVDCRAANETVERFLLPGCSFAAPHLPTSRSCWRVRAAFQRVGALSSQSDSGISCQRNSISGLARARRTPGPNEGELHGPVLAVGRDADSIYRTDNRARPEERQRIPRLPGHLQSPPDLSFLSRLGKVSFFRSL